MNTMSNALYRAPEWRDEQDRLNGEFVEIAIDGTGDFLTDDMFNLLESFRKAGVAKPTKQQRKVKESIQ